MPEAAPFPANSFNKKLQGTLAGGAKESSSSRRATESTQGLPRRFVRTFGILKTYTSVALGSQAQAPQHHQGRVHTGIVAMIAIIAGKASCAQKKHSNQKAAAPVTKERRSLAIAIHLPRGCALAKALSLTGHHNAKA